jgi:hypothetical protein
MEGRAAVYLEWLDATAEAIRALEIWRAYLRDWRLHGGEATSGGFDRALADLVAAGLEDWADRCPAGGGLDVLCSVVEGGGQ